MRTTTFIVKLLGPGCAKTIVAGSLPVKQQLLIIDRSRHRAPRLTVPDRFSLAFCTLILICVHNHLALACVLVGKMSASALLAA